MIAHTSRPLVALESPARRLSIATSALPRLRLFGVPTIDTVHGSVAGRAVQRHRIALLALLATARRATRSRDELIDLLWPDADLDRGRRLLSDSIYRINRAVDAPALTTRSDTVELDRALLASDVADLEAAVAQRDWSRVTELYDAPFLEGLYLPGAAEFDHWLEGERARFRRCAEKAQEALRHGASAVAVLPFRYLSAGDPPREIADALTEEVIAALGRRARIPVASPLSSFAFRDTTLSAIELGERLRVAWLVEGTVRQAGDTLRITARLTDMTTGYQVWSHSADRSGTASLSADVAIANEIAAALGERLQAAYLPRTSSSSHDRTL
jgi:TolB-like protein